MSQQFTPADVAQHNNPEKGLYIIIDSNVYNVTGELCHAGPHHKEPRFSQRAMSAELG